MEQKDIEKQFVNQANQYYAHGIGAYDEKVVKSIFENGLRCSHKELYWTVLEFGKGSETLFKEKEQLMNNWEHKGSKHIMIVSLPEVFHLLDVRGTPLFQKRHAAFYNNISLEEAKKLGIAPGLYLKPEFIEGMYDAEKKDFIVNDRYYENLPEEKQRKVLEDVKKQYIDTISNSGWTLAEYAQILKDIGIECPLTPEEISNNGKEIEQRPDMVTLPNGIQIPRKQYEEEQGTEKQSGNVSISDLKSSILKGKVTTQETQSAPQDMKQLMKIKRLQIMQRTGQTLTPEQKRLLDEHIRQTTETQVRFRNQQDQKKSKGLSL